MRRAFGARNEVVSAQVLHRLELELRLDGLARGRTLRDSQ